MTRGSGFAISSLETTLKNWRNPTYHQGQNLLIFPCNKVVMVDPECRYPTIVKPFKPKDMSHGTGCRPSSIDKCTFLHTAGNEDVSNGNKINPQMTCTMKSSLVKMMGTIISWLREIIRTVDGRNPASVDMENLSSFAGFYPSQVVVWIFFHQQYV